MSDSPTGKDNPQLDLPTISLVTPSYNQAQFLEQTLQSVLEQKYPRLEYIVMDGNSSDGSVDIIQRYAANLTYWVSEPDRGQADAINRGFTHATGDVLGWINSDDILLPGALQVVGELFARYPHIAWVTGLSATIDAAGQTTRMSPRTGKFAPLIRRGWYHGRLLGFIRQESTFWRRELWDKSGGFVDADLTYGMDFDLWRRFAHHADLVSIQTPLAAYRQHPQQKTAALESYYREIGVRLPHAVRLFTLPTRVVIDWVAQPLTPQVRCQPDRGIWQFRPGLFFRPGVF